MSLTILGNAQSGQFTFQIVGKSGTDRRIATIRLGIAAPPPAPPPATTLPPTEPPRVTALTWDRLQVQNGGKLLAIGTGCDPVAPVQLWIGEDIEGTSPQLEKVGEGIATEAGDFKVPMKLPDTIAVGQHSVTAECGVTIEATIKVVAPPRAQPFWRPTYPILAALVVLILITLYRILTC